MKTSRRDLIVMDLVRDRRMLVANLREYRMRGREFDDQRLFSEEKVKAIDEAMAVLSKTEVNE